MFLEDYLLILSTSEIILEKDKQLFRSLAHQVLRKNAALTDRQYDLALSKLKQYKNKIENIDNFKLKMPIRQIDRSRWIKFTDNSILIRYIFNNKLINSLEKIRKWKISADKKNNVYHYLFTDQSCFHIIDVLQKHEFVIDPALVSRYQTLKKMYESPKDYIPGIYNNEIKNIPENAIAESYKKYGSPNADNILLYQDKKLALGLEKVDYDLPYTNPILEKIVTRQSRFVYLTFNDLTSSITTVAKILAESLNIIKRKKIFIVHDFGFLDDNSNNINAAKILENILDNYFDGIVEVSLHKDKDYTDGVLIAINARTKGWFRNNKQNDLIICINDNVNFMLD